VQEDIDLSTYAGQQILLRFIIKSDDYVEYDGWYIDDIRVYQYSLEESSIKSHEPQISYRFHLDQNYPNPFNPVTRIPTKSKEQIRLISQFTIYREIKFLNR